MNSKIERMEKLLKAATIANDNKLATRLVVELMQEWSLEIGRAIQPINLVSLPFIVTACEQYAQALRDIAPPGANAGIDELKRLPVAIIKAPVKGGHDE